MQNKLNNYLEGLQKTNSASYVDFPNLKNKLAKHRGMLDELRLTKKCYSKLKKSIQCLHWEDRFNISAIRN